MILTIPNDEGTAYLPRREQPKEMKDSFFADVYRKAEKNVDEILSQADKQQGRQQNRQALPECSNIIAITGGRGAGKTSVMLNIAEALNQGSRLIDKEWGSKSFVCLPMIDPSHLSKDETVIDVVLARMYQEFDRVRHERTGPTLERCKDTYSAFAEAHRAVGMICKNRENRHSIPDALEGLGDAAAGNELRSKMDKLTRHFLEAMEASNQPTKDPFPCRTRSGCLVLCVDDVDMNVKQGYEICEELRKYLSIPNVIIFFSIHMAQMSDLVRQQYLVDFEPLLKHSATMDMSETIPFMAEKYLQKLIPFDRRCALPSTEVRSLSTISLRYESAEGDPRPLVDEILRLLHEKAGLLLIKDRYNTHAFLPTSLRGIVHLLSMLRKMESVHCLEMDGPMEASKVAPSLANVSYRTLEHNLTTLIHYILECNAVELPKQSEAILKLFSNEPTETLNQRLIHSMLHEMENAKIVLLSKNGENLGELASDRLPAESVTVGDLFCVMRHYRKNIHYYDGNSARFSALFKVLYSIRSLQCFYLESGEGATFDTRKDNLYRMLGGLIYSPAQDDIIRGEKLYSRLSVDTLLRQESRPDFDTLVDPLLIGTVYIGAFEKSDSFLRETFLSFRIQRYPEAYYEDVRHSVLLGATGNRARYFTYSYLGCILSSSQKVADIQNAAYRQWWQAYISPLPVLSADFIDAFVSELWKETESFRKSYSDAFSIAADRGSRNLIDALIERTAIGESAKSYFRNALEEFPFLKEDRALDSYLSQNDPDGNSNSQVYSDAPKDETEAELDSLKVCRSRLERTKDRFEKVDSIDTLLSVQGASRTGPVLSKTEKDFLHFLNQKISSAKLRLKSKPVITSSDFDNTRSTILGYIDNAYATIDAQLKELESR